MPVFALWSAPRARSTAFFRSMVERGDMTALHEPFCNLADYGETDAEGRAFDSPASLLAWLGDHTRDITVFLKDTTDRRHHAVLADRRLLAEARHAFLIRRPEEIAASCYAVNPGTRIGHIGLEALLEMHTAVRHAGGHHPVVLDSDDLVARPEATMAAYCAAVELPFIPQAVTWEPGERPEWRRSPRWHADVSASSGFEQRERRYTVTVESSDELARSPPITCPSTSSSTCSGSMSRRGSQWRPPDRSAGDAGDVRCGSSIQRPAAVAGQVGGRR
jgi:hypothetical protein